MAAAELVAMGLPSAGTVLPPLSHRCRGDGTARPGGILSSFPPDPSTVGKGWFLLLGTEAKVKLPFGDLAPVSGPGWCDDPQGSRSPRPSTPGSPGPREPFSRTGLLSPSLYPLCPHCFKVFLLKAKGGGG